MLVTHLCPTLCSSIDCSLPGSSVHEIFQARTLEWTQVSVIADRFFSFSATRHWDPQKTSESESRSVVSDSLQPHGRYSPQNSPGQNTGVGSRSLLQGIFPTQGSNPGLPHCRQILYQLSHRGSPRILEWGSLFLLQWIFLTQEQDFSVTGNHLDSVFS